MHPVRPRSRLSSATSTVPDSSPPSSWSGPMRPGHPSWSRTSTSDSRWSDDATETPGEGEKGSEGVTVVGRDDGERPLIDFGTDFGSAPTGTGSTGHGSDEVQMTPGDKLRMLLKQMEAEARVTVPIVVPARSVSPEKGGWEAPRSAWRHRRTVERSSRSPPRSVDPSPERPLAHSEDEESPPTPPPRLTNPYIHTSRVVSDERRRTPPLPTAHRMPSRAAVLHASASHSPIKEPRPITPRIPTALETFIATHQSPPPVPQIPQDPSSSRMSQDRSISSSTSSRKGKERAPDISTKQTLPPRRAAARMTPPPLATFSKASRPARLDPVTPRRWSVEIAPDDSALFADEAQSLEVRGEVELDLDDGSGDPPWLDSESAINDDDAPLPAMDTTVRQSPLRPRGSPIKRVDNRQSPQLNDSRSHRSASYSKSSAETAHDRLRRPSEDSFLPPLPEPELSHSADDESEFGTLSSRRSLFRSTSRSPKVSQPPSIVPAQYSQELFIPPQEPVRIGMALLSTPSRLLTADQTISGQTPHPPGRWTAPHVRFSPRDSLTVETSRTDSPVHRLKLSPAKSPSKHPVGNSPMRTSLNKGKNQESDGNTSVTGRIASLARSVTRRSLPGPSTALREAQEALVTAAQASAHAKDRVEKTQRQWLDALTSARIPPGIVPGAVKAVRSSWGWSKWAWWVSVELLLLMGVFRVTLDYANSASYLSTLDPFTIHHSSSAASKSGLSLPLPTAVSAFLIPHRGSANFFDLLESADLWRRLEEMGLVAKVGQVAGLEGVRLLGGVPS